MSDDIHKGDIGTVLEVIFEHDGEPFDISDASTKTIYLAKPDGTLVTKTGAFSTDGTDGRLRYQTTAAGDLNAVGVWSIQGYVEMASWTGRTNIGKFQVNSNLE